MIWKYMKGDKMKMTDRELNALILGQWIVMSIAFIALLFFITN